MQSPADDTIVAVTLGVRRAIGVQYGDGTTTYPFGDPRPAWQVQVRRWNAPEEAWLYTSDEYGDHAREAARAHVDALLDQIEA